MDSKWINIILLGLPMLFKFILDLMKCRREKKRERETEEMQSKLLKVVEDDFKNKAQ